MALKNKILLLLLSLFLINICLGQKTQVLDLKTRKYFSEKNTFWIDSSITLYQEVNYNEPSVIDEEYCFYLVIQFRDISDLKKKDVFDLGMDSAFVNVKFKRNSVWDWSPLKKINAGSVKILSRRKNYMEIELSFSTISEKYETEYFYSGIRKFIKGKEPNYFARIVLP